MKKLLVVLILLSTFSSAQSQPNVQIKKLSSDFLNFFIGDWSGDGEFANGRKISADLTFLLSLDSSWLAYEHYDKLPNKYKVFSMWGVEAASGQFIAYSFDNFHGHRKFASDGWKENKLSPLLVLRGGMWAVHQQTRLMEITGV